MTHWEVTTDEGKVKALHVRILEECKRQGFTINDFDSLIKNLQRSANTRHWEIPQSLPLIPAGKSVADYLAPNLR